MKNTHIVYGFVTALAIIIVNLVLYVTGNAFNSWAQYVGYVPFLIGLILNANAFSKANEEGVTFGKLFASCYKACAIITLVVLAWSYIAFAIFPDMMDKGMEMARQKMSERGNISQEQMDQGMEMTRKYFKVFMAMGIIFGYMFVGAIFSLIGAGLAKKKPTTTMPY